MCFKKGVEVLNSLLLMLQDRMHLFGGWAEMVHLCRVSVVTELTDKLITKPTFLKIVYTHYVLHSDMSPPFGYWMCFRTETDQILLAEGRFQWNSLCKANFLNMIGSSWQNWRIWCYAYSLKIRFGLNLLLSTPDILWTSILKVLNQHLLEQRGSMIASTLISWSVDGGL